MKQNTLKNAYEALTTHEKEVFRIKTCAQLSLSVPTLYRKLEDPVLFSDVEYKHIGESLYKILQLKIEDIYHQLANLEKEINKPFKIITHEPNN